MLCRNVFAVEVFNSLVSLCTLVSRFLLAQAYCPLNSGRGRYWGYNKGTKEQNVI